MAHSHHRIPALDKDHKDSGHVGRRFAPRTTRTWMAKDSDLFPSVSLAAVLSLVFLFVLPVLFQPHKDYVPLRRLSNLHAKTVHFHPLLYGQPLSTQLTLEKLIQNVGEEAAVLAAAAGDALRTLECFTTNLMSLMADRGQASIFDKRVREYKPPFATWNNGNGLPSFFSVAVITQVKGGDPQGVIMNLPSFITGHLHVTEISTAKSQRDALDECLSIATKLLHHLNKTGNIPQTFEIRNSTGQLLEVLKIHGDPYLESGLVC